MASMICCPMVKTGFSEVMGSWNTMLMRAPRTRRMALSDSTDAVTLAFDADPAG